MAPRVTYPNSDEVLDYIVEHTANNIVPPSMREIAERFDMALNTAHRMILRLEEEGCIRRAPGRARAIQVVRDE